MGKMNIHPTNDKAAAALCQIRCLGSLLITAGFSEQAFREWNSVATAGEMIVDLAETTLDLFDTEILKEKIPDPANPC